MSIRAILFDKDGTLVDFHSTWSPAAYAAMQRLSAGDGGKMARLIEVNDYDLENRRIRPSSVLVAQSSADYGVTWAEILGETADTAFFERMDRIFIEEGLKHVTPIGDPPRLLSTLKDRGYLIGICTNDSEAGARAHCEKLGLLPWLDAVMGYDSGHGRKPDPGPVLGFADRFGLLAGEVALVGDSVHDLSSVRAAGGTAIAVLSGFAGRDELAPYADYVIESVMDLPDLLESLKA
jgi:phosphoglycolate phosphatase